VNNPYTYTSRERDKESNLYFYRARYYDPSIGRFVSVDPIGFEGGDVNLYAYVGSNPANFNDPYGLFFGSLGTKVVGKIVGSTAQEIAIAGKVADSAVAVGIEMSGISENVPDVLGYTGDALQAVGGAQTLTLAGAMATYSSVTPIAPLVLAGLGGAEIGFAFNHFYERISGQSLGEDIYDWLHPEDKNKPCP